MNHNEKENTNTNMVGLLPKPELISRAGPLGPGQGPCGSLGSALKQ